MKLSQFSVHQPIAALMFFLALALIGGFAASRLSVDMYPDIEPPVISIVTTWPGASASDVETEITQPIEDRVASVNNIDELTSKSLDNLSIVACRFNWGANLDTATNDIRDKLSIARRDLPHDAEEPIPFKFSSATAPIMFMTVTAGKNWPRLHHYADKIIGDALKRVPGVGTLTLYGGQRRRFNVYFDRDQIEAYRLSLHQINQALAAENRNIPAGSIKSGIMEYAVRLPGRFQDAEHIRDTVVGRFNGRPVYLRDVARVEDGFETLAQNGWGDGARGIVLVLQKQTGKNTVAVARGVKNALRQLQQSLPPDIRINIIMDTSQDIIHSIDNLKLSLMWGIALIVAVSLLFLRRLRTAFIVVLIIPASLMIAFIFIHLFGYTLNLVTLMALAIASGMVVDNGIVVLENIIRHIENGDSIETAAIQGAGEMGLAITASTMTTIVIFVPLMFLTGMAGIVFKPLGFVLTATLLASLLVALMLTPMMCAKLVRATPTTLKQRASLAGRLYRLSEYGFEALERGYGRLLKWSLCHRKTVLAMAMAIFFSSLSLVPFLSTSFFPIVDTGEVSIRFRLPEGTRIEETNRIVETVFAGIDQIVKPEEMRHSYGYDGEDKYGFGAALGFDQGPNVGHIGFKLVDRDQRDRSATDIANLLRQRMSAIAGIDKIQVSAESSVNAALAGGAKPISLEIQGPDLQINLEFARQVNRALAPIAGLVDVEISQKDPRPELWAHVDRRKAADMGLNASVIGATLRNYYYGMQATEFRDAGKSYDVFTRFTDADKDRIDGLAHVPLLTADGRMVTLNNVATIVHGYGPIEIQRKNRQRLVKIEADLYQRSLGEVTADIQTALAGLDIPPGVSIAFGGDIDEQKKAFMDLTTLLIIGILLVYMLMASLFGNLRDPFIIMFAVPFAFTGVIYAFYLTGTTLGIMSFMGIVMLMGIVVNNAIVLIDYIHQLQGRGIALHQAVIQAGHDRLRPVLMTTMTTFFGMLPLAASNAVGAESWNPLGITMLGGLSVSTLVTLVLAPTIYYALESRKRN